MKVREIYKLCLSELERYGVSDYRFEAAQLFWAITGVKVAELPLKRKSAESEVRPEAMRKLKRFLARRRRGEPLQYILGEWEFYGLSLLLGPGVLIPRQETELVVDIALECLAARENPLVADLCSGCGAIALALFSRSPEATIYAVDKSERALRYLHKNVFALVNSGDIKTGRGHFYIVRGDVTRALALPMLDLLVANPPYLSLKEMHNISREVSHEPKMALHGGSDGLRVYRAILRTQSHLVKDGGFIVFEIGYTQGEAVRKLLEEAGFKDVEIIKDYSGNDRCVRAAK